MERRMVQGVGGDGEREEMSHKSCEFLDRKMCSSLMVRSKGSFATLDCLLKMIIVYGSFDWLPLIGMSRG
uniref:Uncharacterized protein n=1 Tax=Caenorhabditis japonica TaxID=281687 RepID=A0A8R1IDK8_CAEJA